MYPQAPPGILKRRSVPAPPLQDYFFGLGIFITRTLKSLPALASRAWGHRPG